MLITSKKWVALLQLLGIGLMVFLVVAWLAPTSGSARRNPVPEDNAPGLGEALSTTLPAGSRAGLAADESVFLRQIPLITNDLIVDPKTQTVYASVPGGSSARDNSLTPIDPSSGTLAASVFVGSNPNKLAMSDDGQFIYVGLDGEAAVRRFVVSDRSAGLRFGLGSSPDRGPYIADDIAVLPGVPESIAVARKVAGFSPSHAGVAIYDDSVQRPVTTPSDTINNEIEFSATADNLYGFNTQTTGLALSRLSVTPSGVAIAGPIPGLLGEFGHIEFNGGLLYHAAGKVVDPEAKKVIGTYSGMNFYPFISARSFAVDVPNNRVYFLTGGKVDDFGGNVPATIYAFNRTTFELTGSIQVSGVTTGLSSLKRWGSNGLVFRDNKQVYLLQTSIVPSSDPVPSPTPTPSPTATPTPVPTPLAGEFRQIDLATKDIVLDSQTQTIYASVSSTAGANANSLTALNPVTSAAGPSVSLGSEPNKLAISDDNKFVYVGLDGVGKVRRVDLSTGASNLEFPLDPVSGKTAEDIAVMPGSSGTVAIVRKAGTSEEVVIYENGAPRPLTVFESTSSLAFSNAPSVLYGYNANSSSSDFRKMAVGPCGVGQFQASKQLLNSNNTNIKYDNGRVYSAQGHVIDSESGTLVGTFSVPEQIGFSQPPIVATDSRVQRIYSLVIIDSVARLRVFDMETFVLVGELSLPGVTGSPSSLIRWGADGLAFRTPTKVFLLQDALIGGNSTSFTPAPLASEPRFSVKGHISDSGGGVGSGVTVSFTGARTGTVQTDSNGDYTIDDLSLCSNLIITPSRRYYVFSPSSISISNLDTPTANFTETHKTVGFVSAQTSAREVDGIAFLAVSRSSTANTPITLSYTANNGTALEGSDFAVGSGTFTMEAGIAQAPIRIPIIDDLYVEGPETFTVTLSKVDGPDIELINPVINVTIVDNDSNPPTTNPLDNANFFVRQQYFDFLNREPDPGGLGYWSGEITKCGSDPNCIHDRRVGVADAFFFEDEFQLTGAYIYRVFKAAFGVLPTYDAFKGDRGRVVAGASLESSKNSYVLEFVQRDAFLAMYPRSQTADQFVDALLNTIKKNSGVDLAAQRTNLI